LSFPSITDHGPHKTDSSSKLSFRSQFSHQPKQQPEENSNRKHVIAELSFSSIKSLTKTNDFPVRGSFIAKNRTLNKKAKTKPIKYVKDLEFRATFMLDDEELERRNLTQSPGNGLSLPERDKTPTNRAESWRKRSTRTLAVHYSRVFCLVVVLC
jgi:hypothetical protein